MACDGCNCYFPFWAIFCLFTPATCSKNENFKKMKKIIENIIILHKCAKNHAICYAVPEIWCMTDVIVILNFGLFLPFYPPNSPKNQNFKKMKKTLGDIIILHMCTKNFD